MKKTIILIITIFLATGFKGTVQQIDEKRMNKDLEIAKNILGTLIKTESGSFFGGEAIKADYIKDYGVIFTIPEHLVYFHTGTPYPVVIPEIVIPEIHIPPMPEYNFEFKMENLSDKERAEMEKAMEKAKKDMKAAQEEMQKIQQQLNEVQEKEMKNRQAQQEKAVQAQVEAQFEQQEALALLHEGNINEDLAPPPPGLSSDINWEEIMITFLADYADLISQLKPEERVVVKQQSPGAEFGLIWEGEDDERAAGVISAEAKKQDISAYKTGKISRDEFVKRVVLKKAEPQKKIADLEMFSSVLNRFFSQDLTESLVVLGRARYEKLDGFGVIYYVNAESPDRIRSRRFYSQDQLTYARSSGDAASAGSEGLEKLYVTFKKDIKEFILDYGRTIRSVQDKEKVELKIQLPQCGQCSMPKTLIVAAPVSVLKQYDQQKITKEKALEQIETTEK